MKVRVDQDGDIIDMERDDIPEIGELGFQANSPFAFQVISVEWCDAFGGYIARTKKMRKNGGEISGERTPQDPLSGYSQTAWHEIPISEISPEAFGFLGD